MVRETLYEAYRLAAAAFVVGALLLTALYTVMWYSEPFARAIGPVPIDTPVAIESLTQLRDSTVIWTNYSVALVFLAVYALVISPAQLALGRMFGIAASELRTEFGLISALAGAAAGAVQFVATIGFCKAGCIGDRLYAGVGNSLGLDQLVVALGFIALPFAIVVVGAALSRLHKPATFSDLR